MSKVIPAILIVGVVGYLIYSLAIRKEAPRLPTPQAPPAPIMPAPIMPTSYEVVRG